MTTATRAAERTDERTAVLRRRVRLVVAATIAFLIALRGELPDREIPGQAWLAEPKGMTWLLLPFALTGRWVTCLAALACYAACSFFWAQRQSHRPISAARPD